MGVGEHVLLLSPRGSPPPFSAASLWSREPYRFLQVGQKVTNTQISWRPGKRLAHLGRGTAVPEGRQAPPTEGPWEGRWPGGRWPHGWQGHVGSGSSESILHLGGGGAQERSPLLTGKAPRRDAGGTWVPQLLPAGTRTSPRLPRSSYVK